MTDNHNFVTDFEVEAHMRPHLNSLMSLVVPRKPKPQGGHDRQNGKVAKQQGMESCDEKELCLSPEKVAFLEDVLEYPNDSVTQRQERLGLSTYMNAQIKTQLSKLGLIQEFTVNLGVVTKGIIKLAMLTQKGFQMLGKPIPKARSYSCSHEHYWWQNNLHQHFKELGLMPVIEMNLNGKRVDVGFVENGLNVAVEVAITPKNEVLNCKKDFEAGFNKVIVGCKNVKVRQVVQEKFRNALSAEQLRNTEVVLLSDFPFLKKMVRKL